MKEGLFYSENENILFGVAGYTDNSDNVDEIVKMLEERKANFIKAGGEGDIKTIYITKSMRYKSMRVFYCKTKKIPEGVFKLGKDWTMMKWLTN